MKSKPDKVDLKFVSLDVSQGELFVVWQQFFSLSAFEINWDRVKSVSNDIDICLHPIFMILMGIFPNDSFEKCYRSFYFS